jgi:hypothetical protein
MPDVCGPAATQTSQCLPSGMVVAVGAGDMAKRPAPRGQPLMPKPMRYAAVALAGLVGLTGAVLLVWPVHVSLNSWLWGLDRTPEGLFSEAAGLVVVHRLVCNHGTEVIQ